MWYDEEESALIYLEREYSSTRGESVRLLPKNTEIFVPFNYIAGRLRANVF